MCADLKARQLCTDSFITAAALLQRSLVRFDASALEIELRRQPRFLAATGASSSPGRRQRSSSSSGVSKQSCGGCRSRRPQQLQLGQLLVAEHLIEVPHFREKQALRRCHRHSAERCSTASGQQARHRVWLVGALSYQHQQACRARAE